MLIILSQWKCIISKIQKYCIPYSDFHVSYSMYYVGELWQVCTMLTWKVVIHVIYCLIVDPFCFPFTQEKKALKEEKMKQEEKYTWAIVDGVKEKVISCSLFSCYFLLILIQLLWLVIDHYVL